MVKLYTSKGFIMKVFSIDDLSEETKGYFLKSIDQTILFRVGFLNRVISSIELKGVKFTALKEFNLPVDLVDNIKKEFKVKENSRKLT